MGLPFQGEAAMSPNLNMYWIASGYNLPALERETLT
jgi:hypothetical protein